MVKVMNTTKQLAVKSDAQLPAAKSRKTPSKRSTAVASTDGAVKSGTRSRKPRAVKTVAADERHRMIELRAYYRAEGRGFVTGFELDDWLAAEAEVEQLLQNTPSSKQ